MFIAACFLLLPVYHVSGSRAAESISRDIEILRGLDNGITFFDAIRITGATADEMRAAKNVEVVLPVMLLTFLDPHAVRLIRGDLFSLTAAEAAQAAGREAFSEVTGVDAGMLIDALLGFFRGHNLTQRIGQTQGDIYLVLGRHESRADRPFYNGWFHIVDDLHEMDDVQLDVLRLMLESLHIKSLDETATNPCGCSLGFSDRPRLKAEARPNCWQAPNLFQGSGGSYDQCPKACDGSFFEEWVCPIEEVVPALEVSMPPDSARTVVMLIDSSGSMKENDPRNLRIEALWLAIASADPQTSIGLVEFDDEATVLIEPRVLGEPGSEARRELLKATRRIDAEGGTNISAGLDASASAAGSSDASLILLTDGKDKDWTGDAGSWPLSAPVHTVALSEQADRKGLRNISASTGGTADIALIDADLHRILGSLFGEAEDQELLLVENGDLKPDERHLQSVVVEPGVGMLVIQVTWPGSDIDMNVLGPDGLVVTIDDAVQSALGVEGTTFEVIQIPTPKAGAWNVELTGIDVLPSGEPYTLRVTARGSDVQTEWALTGSLVGQPVAVALSGSENVSWERGSVVWWGPDGRGGERDIVLNDDLFRRGSEEFQLGVPSLPGIHRVRLQLTGHTRDGHPIIRSFDRSFEVADALDSEPPAAVESDRYMSLNEIIRSLAPYEYLPEHSGKKPSIDLDVKFRLNSAELTKEAVRQLDELGGAMNSSDLTGVRFTIAGHTDATGSPAYNKVLSEERAAAVKAYLVANHDVLAERLETEGWGEERLKDTLSPEAAINRRVEVIALNPPIEQPVEKKGKRKQIEW